MWTRKDAEEIDSGLLEVLNQTFHEGTKEIQE